MGLGDRAFETRANIIGGSEVATILGLNPWSTRAGLMAQKLSGIKPETSVERERIMATGKAMEDTVMQFFREANPNREFQLIGREPQYFIRDDEGHEVIVTHPDGMWREIDKGGQRKTVRLLEIKTTTGWRDDISERSVPKEYEVQTQIEMHGARQNGSPVNVVDLAIYNLASGKLHCHQAVYDEPFCKMAVGECSKFKALMNSDRPIEEIVKAVAGPQDDVNSLLLIAAGEDSLEVGDDAKQLRDVAQMLDRYAQASSMAKTWAAELTMSSNEIRNMMGDKLTLEVLGERVVSYSNVKGSARNAKVIREMQGAMSSPEAVRLVAQTALGKLSDIPDISEDALVDAIEPALTLMAVNTAESAIERHTGTPGRQFRPNLKKIELLLSELNVEKDKSLGR